MADTWDPFDETHIGDPFPIYRRLRDAEPLYRSERHDFWALSRYDDVAAANADWKRFRSGEGVDLDDTGSLFFGPGNIVESDPPDHEQLRAVVRHHLTPKLVTSLEPDITAKVGRLMDGLDERTESDLVADLCLPLPLAVVGELLGFEPDLQDWVYDRFLRMFYRESGSTEVPDAAMKAASDVRGVLADELRKRTAKPREDLLTVIAHGRAGERPLTEQEQVGMSTLLVGAGISTTKNLLSNVLWYLATADDVRRALEANPEGAAGAVEEFLRYDSPIQNSTRVTSEDVELHGQLVPAGSRVTLIYGSANRDERRYDDPDSVVLGRKVGRHFAFGGGIHMCIGAPLARLEARVVLQAGLPRLRRYELSGEPLRSLKMNERGFETLPVRFVA